MDSTARLRFKNRETTLDTERQCKDLADAGEEIAGPSVSRQGPRESYTGHGSLLVSSAEVDFEHSQQEKVSHNFDPTHKEIDIYPVKKCNVSPKSGIPVTTALAKSQRKSTTSGTAIKSQCSTSPHEVSGGLRRHLSCSAAAQSELGMPFQTTSKISTYNKRLSEAASLLDHELDRTNSKENLKDTFGQPIELAIPSPGQPCEFLWSENDVTTCAKNSNNSVQMLSGVNQNLWPPSHLNRSQISGSVSPLDFASGLNQNVHTTPVPLICPLTSSMSCSGSGYDLPTTLIGRPSYGFDQPVSSAFRLKEARRSSHSLDLATAAHCNEFLPSLSQQQLPSLKQNTQGQAKSGASSFGPASQLALPIYHPLYYHPINAYHRLSPTHHHYHHKHILELYNDPLEAEFAKATAAAVLAASESRPRQTITEVPIELYAHAQRSRYPIAGSKSSGVMGSRSRQTREKQMHSSDQTLTVGAAAANAEVLAVGPQLCGIDQRARTLACNIYSTPVALSTTTNVLSTSGVISGIGCSKGIEANPRSSSPVAYFSQDVKKPSNGRQIGKTGESYSIVGPTLSTSLVEVSSCRSNYPQHLLLKRETSIQAGGYMPLRASSFSGTIDHDQFFVPEDLPPNELTREYSQPLQEFDRRSTRSLHLVGMGGGQSQIASSGAATFPNVTVPQVQQLPGTSTVVSTTTQTSSSWNKYSRHQHCFETQSNIGTIVMACTSSQQPSIITGSTGTRKQVGGRLLARAASWRQSHSFQKLAVSLNFRGCESSSTGEFSSPAISVGSRKIPEIPTDLSSTRTSCSLAEMNTWALLGSGRKAELGWTMRRRKGNFRTLAQTNKTAAGGDPSIAEPHRRHSRKPLLVHSNSIIPAVSNMAPCKEELIFRKTGRPRSLYRSKSLNRSNPRTDSHLKEHISSQEVTSFSASIAATNAASSSAGLNAGACTINAKITPTTLESGEINIHRCVQFSMSLCDMGIQADLANDGSERIRDIWTRQVDELHREVQVQSDEDFDLWIALATPHSEEASGIKPGDTPSRLVDRQVCCGRVISNDIRNKNQRDETHESRLMVSASTVATTTETEELGEEEEEENNDERPSNEARTSASAYLKEQFLSFFQPSDNKLAMKLFGTKNALNKERRRQQQQGKWIIHPCSSFRFYWDLMMLVLLIANLIVLPVAISFFDSDLSLHWLIYNCASDTIFLIDIAVNFRTGIITNDYADEIILGPKQIAREYLRSWFGIDFLSSIPMDYLYLMIKDEESDSNPLIKAGRALRFLRFVKILSLLRLLRLSRLVRYVSQWEEFLNIASKFMGIFNLVLLMLLLGHWNACLQFLIPKLYEFPLDSWVVKCRLKESYWFQQYTWALFKAMSHMLSIGYGRFPPTSTHEAWITIVSMMTGATCYALFVGHAAALIQSFDCSKRLYREKFKQVEEYMVYRKLPRALRQRITNYYEHRYQGKMFNENAILNELSECLREQIVNYNCRALVAAVPFFTYADQDFVSEVVVKLRYEVFQPGDLVIKEGTIGTKMYFIQEGIVDIITKDGEVATSLSDGSYFGEICLLTNARRVASVRAETYCNVYSLDRASFLEVLDNYPLMRRTMESVAAERLSKIGQDPLVVSTRNDLREDLKLVKEIVNQATPISSDTDSKPSEEPSDSDSITGFARHLRRRRMPRVSTELTWPRKSADFGRRKSVVQLVQEKIHLMRLRTGHNAVSQSITSSGQLKSTPTPSSSTRSTGGGIGGGTRGGGDNHHLCGRRFFSSSGNTLCGVGGSGAEVENSSQNNRSAENEMVNMEAIPILPEQSQIKRSWFHFSPPVGSGESGPLSGVSLSGPRVIVTPASDDPPIKTLSEPLLSHTSRHGHPHKITHSNQIITHHHHRKHHSHRPRSNSRPGALASLAGSGSNDSSDQEDAPSGGIQNSIVSGQTGGLNTLAEELESAHEEEAESAEDLNQFLSNLKQGKLKTGKYDDIIINSENSHFLKSDDTIPIKEGQINEKTLDNNSSLLKFEGFGLLCCNDTRATLLKTPEKSTADPKDLSSEEISQDLEMHKPSQIGDNAVELKHLDEENMSCVASSSCMPVTGENKRTVTRFSTSIGALPAGAGSDTKQKRKHGKIYLANEECNKLEQIHESKESDKEM